MSFKESRLPPVTQFGEPSFSAKGIANDPVIVCDKIIEPSFKHRNDMAQNGGSLGTIWCMRTFPHVR